MKGTYILIIELNSDKKIQIGKFDKIFFKKGFYIYVGSALNGLDQRIKRHLKKDKKMHWHIDYLLKDSEIVKILYRKNNYKEECKIAKNFIQKLENIAGFGCSDCKCKSHLFYGTYKDVFNSIKNLDLNSYNS